MCFSKTLTKENFIQRVRRILRPKKGEVTPELQQALNDCTTISQLLELLFSIDFVMDEAVLDAFDKRIDELDPSGNPIY